MPAQAELELDRDLSQPDAVPDETGFLSEVESRAEERWRAHTEEPAYALPEELSREDLAERREAIVGAWFGTEDFQTVSLYGAEIGPSQIEGFAWEVYVNGQPLSALLDAAGKAYYAESVLPSLHATGVAAFPGRVEGGEVIDGSLMTLEGGKMTVEFCQRTDHRLDWDEEYPTLPLLEDSAPTTEQMETPTESVVEYTLDAELLAFGERRVGAGSFANQERIPALPVRHEVSYGPSARMTARRDAGETEVGKLDDPRSTREAQETAPQAVRAAQEVVRRMVVQRDPREAQTRGDETASPPTEPVAPDPLVRPTPLLREPRGAGGNDRGERSMNLRDGTQNSPSLRERERGGDESDVTSPRPSSTRRGEIEDRSFLAPRKDDTAVSSSSGMEDQTTDPRVRGDDNESAREPNQDGDASPSLRERELGGDVTSPRPYPTRRGTREGAEALPDDDSRQAEAPPVGDGTGAGTRARKTHGGGELPSSPTTRDREQPADGEAVPARTRPFEARAGAEFPFPGVAAPPPAATPPPQKLTAGTKGVRVR